MWLSPLVLLSFLILSSHHLLGVNIPDGIPAKLGQRITIIQILSARILQRASLTAAAAWRKLVPAAELLQVRQSAPEQSEIHTPGHSAASCLLGVFEFSNLCLRERY